MVKLKDRPVIQGSVCVIINDGSRTLARRYGTSKPLVQVMEVKGDVAYITENTVGLSAISVMGSLLSDKTIKDGVRLVTWKTQAEDGYLDDYLMPLVPVPLIHLEIC
jgi:hypothetical protein